MHQWTQTSQAWHWNGIGIFDTHWISAILFTILLLGVFGEDIKYLQSIVDIYESLRSEEGFFFLTKRHFQR